MTAFRSGKKPNCAQVASADGAERFAAPGWPTGGPNMWRSSRSPRSRRAFPHHLALLVPCVHITAGVGLIDSHAMPGGDHHACVSRWQAFPRLWLSSNKRRNQRSRNLFSDGCPVPSEPIVRARNLCLFPPSSTVSFSHFIAHLFAARCASRGKNRSNVSQFAGNSNVHPTNVAVSFANKTGCR